MFLIKQAYQIAVLKKVLIITYYWPPSGGSGVQRWLYFVKYLRLYGWEPIVYTVENGEYPYLDKGLAKHIPEGITEIRTNIWEPYEIYRRFTGKKQKVNPTIFANAKNAGILKKLAVWIRGNLFIPDPRIFWRKPSVRYLEDYLQKNHIDLIVSTGPPHSMHLIARDLKRKLNIPWLADFRDPWTQIYFFEQMQMSQFVKSIHKKLEKSVLKEADIVVTVSEHCKLGLQKIVNRNIEVITNGFEEFELKPKTTADNKIRMICAGALSLDRNPEKFWKVLENYISNHPELKNNFELLLIGDVDSNIINHLKNSTLNEYLYTAASMPHAALQQFLINADVLLLIGVPSEPGVITGKFFEYLYLKKPIYSISPSNSDVVDILNETRSGFNADFNDEQTLYNNLESVFQIIQSKSFELNDDAIQKYSRKNLTGLMVGLFDKIVVAKDSSLRSE